MSAFMLSSINRKQKNELEFELEIEIIIAIEIEVIVIRTRRYHIDEKNDYIRERIRSWSKNNFKNENLWKQFRHDFADWDKARFKLTIFETQRKLRAYLKLHDFWIKREREIVITKTFANTMKKKTQTRWTEEKIKNNIESFDFDVINHLRKTNFERNSRDYSWQISSRFESRRTSSRQSLRKSFESRESSLRDRSIKERTFQQASMRQLSRESSITRNFFKQSSSSSFRSKIQKISQSSFSEISKTFYSDSSSSFSFKNFYLRQSFLSEKKSMFRQSFQSSCFSKFYQSFQFSKQFYKRSNEYSSFVSSRSFVSSFSSMNQSIKTSNYERELVNLIKLYTDEAKYNEKNDNFSFKLIMFNDMCDRIDVLFEIKLKAFSTMLKRLALNYYYANVINSEISFTFDDVYILIMNYFEDAEYKRSILNKWNNLTLKSIMNKTENEEKSMNECLQLLIKELRHLQHNLESTLRIDDFIHNKLVNACQKISACQYACFKSSDNLTKLINDLKSSIITYQKTHFIEFSFFIEFIVHFIDRRYHRNFSSRISVKR
jgi:hypothetical protein